MARAENLAIMFVDMAGFAQRTARQSRDQNKALLRDFNGLLMPLIARFGGQRIKSIGDALMVTFRSPTDSVRCGMAMHDAVAHYNQKATHDEPLQIRVALNAGEVRLESSDIFGEAVNIAARVEELTPPGEIYLTGVVYLSMNKAEVPAEHIGEQVLKGIPEPVRLFRVPTHKLARLTTAGESLDAAPGELPYGGMHVLPANSDVLMKLAESLRRAPYVDWGAKARAIPTRTVLTGIAGVGLATAVVTVAYALLAMKPAPPLAPVEAAMTLLPAPVAANPKAREALASAHTAYFERRRSAAAVAYARVLQMDPGLRHDSGLAANLVGTLGYAGDVPMEAIRKYPSAEFVFELGRRTGQPGRRGAQRAAALLKEQGQAGRIDRAGMAITDFNEAPTCEERLAAIRTMRELRDLRALPVLRGATQRSFKDMFREDKNGCLRDEAAKTIVELEKLSPSPAS
jgi:class 3 adenylate cyclase